jgi:hypothetical protein
MNKENLLKIITDTAYNVGFGAKKHFATFDIIEKVPGLIGFFSLGIGIFALFIDVIAVKHMSAILIILGIIGIIITKYNETKLSYDSNGKELTSIFNELKELYYIVKSSDKSDFTNELSKFKEIESKYNLISISKQILFSDWLAHYKFFWQQQIEWIDEQKHFKFFRDKIPLSLSFFILILILACLIYLCYRFKFINIF